MQALETSEISPETMAGLIAQDKADKAAAAAGLPTYRDLANMARNLHALLGMVSDFGAATDGLGHPDAQNAALDDGEQMLARVPS